MKHHGLILSTVLFLFGTQTAFADECQLEITGNDAMQFNATELSVPSSCQEVTLTLTHVGKLAINVMGHNWVLTAADDVSAVSTAGMSAGLENNYVPKEDAKVLAATKVIGGGESTTVTFSVADLTVGQDYAYFCSFPGHWAIMKGTFKVTE